MTQIELVSFLSALVRILKSGADVGMDLSSQVNEKLAEVFVGVKVSVKPQVGDFFTLSDGSVVDTPTDYEIATGKNTGKLDMIKEYKHRTQAALRIAKMACEEHFAQNGFSFYNKYYA